MAEKAPDIYSYKIINEYPHDKKCDVTTFQTQTKLIFS